MFEHADANHGSSEFAWRSASCAAAGDRSARYATDLLIDGWLVQPMVNCLTRNGTRVRLRAQLMDLLLCLASRPGKVLAKSEIVGDVWEGRWIADSALSRCMTELRAAIGDDAKHPRVIETIAKRGYRLIAPVEFPAEAVPAPSPGSAGDWWQGGRAVMRESRMSWR